MSSALHLPIKYVIPLHLFYVYTKTIFSAAGSTDKALIFALHGFYQPTVRLKESLFFPSQSKTVKEIL